MASFKYNAVNQAGEVVQGSMEAANRAELERRLKRSGLNIISANEAKKGFGGTFFKQKVTRDELAQFCFYVERLVAGGVPLLEGLADVRDSINNSTLRTIVGTIITDIEQGATLSAAMKKHPKIFDDIFISLIKAGEHSGELDTVLHSLAESIKWQDEIIKKTKKVFTYPIVALVVMMAATYGLLVLVVPGMTRVLTSLGGELPPHTIALINTSDFLQENFVDIIIGIVVLIFAIKFAIKGIPGVDYILDKFKIRMPIFGSVFEKLLLSRFSNIFGLLYGSGVNVLEGLKISRGAVGNKFVAKGLDKVIDDIAGGMPISNAFQTSGLFPPLVLRMIRLGEATGGLDSAMMQVKSYYDRDAQEAIEAAQGAIGPLVLVLVASLLVWVIAAVYGPLYDLVGNIQA